MPGRPKGANLAPADNPADSPTDSRSLFAWLWRGYLSRHKATMGVALVLMAIDGSMMGALSYMLEPMFDQVFVGGDVDAIWCCLLYTSPSPRDS